MMNGSSSGVKDMAGHQMWNNVGHSQQQQQVIQVPSQQQQQHHRNNVVDDREENQSLRSDHSNSMGGLSSSNRIQSSSRSSRHHQHGRPLASTQSNKSSSSGHHRSHRSVCVHFHLLNFLNEKGPTSMSRTRCFSSHLMALNGKTRDIAPFGPWAGPNLFLIFPFMESHRRFYTFFFFFLFW